MKKKCKVFIVFIHDNPNLIKSVFSKRFNLFPTFSQHRGYGYEKKVKVTIEEL